MVQRWNTKILTFSLKYAFDVTSYHPLGTSSWATINKGACDKCASAGRARSFGYASVRTMTALRPQVVIVGAGAAGLSAASRLLANGVNDLIILEAENRIGGRIHSVDFAGSVLDLGAQWCHGQERNIVYDMVKDLDLLSPSLNDYRDYTFYRFDGRQEDKVVTDRLVQLAYQIFDDAEAASKFDGTLGEYFAQEFQKRVRQTFKGDVTAQKVSKLVTEWFHKMVLCLDSCETWHEMSVKGSYKFEYCEGDLYLQWRNRGYKAFLDVLTKKIPDASKQLPIDDKILLNKEVTRILWDSNQVTVKCHDGSSFKCDHLILTVSLGVLKAMKKSFEPELPQLKQIAIDTMGFGAIKKIFLKFPVKWWPDDAKGFSFLWSDEDKIRLRQAILPGPMHNERVWLEDIVGFYVIDNHPSVLLGWFVGKMVEEVENLSDHIVVEGCVMLLKHFLGNYYEVTTPDAVLRSKWKNNPHFRGAYCYTSVRSEESNVSQEDLASPVVNKDGKQVLLFAGEATHSSYYSTVHGATESGFREADRILHMYRLPKLIHHKVAIVGAGMAGLGAAKTLERLGCRDFVIVEAQNRLGGRVHSLEFEDTILELGAQWIHGKNNPLYELALQNGLISDVTSEEGLGLYVTDDGQSIDQSIVKRVDFEVGKILFECEKFVNASNYPESVGEYMEDKFNAYLKNCNDPADVKEIMLGLFDWHVRFQIIDNSCSNLKDLSAKSWGQYVCLDDTAHFNLNCSFKRFIDVMAQSIPKQRLLLSTPVTAILDNSIVCENGLVITCDHIILTPSLAALKRLKITPPLPAEMSSSLNEIGFDAIGKIFLIFDRKWWDEDGLQLIWRRNSEEKTWLKHISGFDPIVHGSKVLLAWVGAEGVDAMEKLSEEEVGTQCLQLLRRFLPKRVIPEPTKVVRTSWLSNPYIRGGYSHMTSLCDRSGSSMQKLAEPVFAGGKPRILLAGEAAHSSHYSTAHGAFESGLQQAEILAGYLNNSKL